MRAILEFSERETITGTAVDKVNDGIQCRLTFTEIRSGEDFDQAIAHLAKAKERFLHVAANLTADGAHTRSENNYE